MALMWFTLGLIVGLSVFVAVELLAGLRIALARRDCRRRMLQGEDLVELPLQQAHPQQRLDTRQQLQLVHGLREEVVGAAFDRALEVRSEEHTSEL